MLNPSKVYFLVMMCFISCKSPDWPDKVNQLKKISPEEGEREFIKKEFTLYMNELIQLRIGTGVHFQNSNWRILLPLGLSSDLNRVLIIVLSRTDDDGEPTIKNDMNWFKGINYENSWYFESIIGT